MSRRRWLKSAFGEAVLRTASVGRFEDRVLDRLDDMPLFDRPVDDEIASYALDSDQRRGIVLFPMVQGRRGIGSWPFRYGVFAHAFRTRGYEPIVLLCDSDLYACFQKQSDARAYPYCAQCHRAGQRLLNGFGLDGTTIESTLGEGYEPPPLETVGETYRDVPVENLALASVKRDLLKSRVDVEDPAQRTALDEYRRSTTILADAADRLFEEHDLAAVLTMDASYIYGGVFMHKARAHGVPAYQFGTGVDERMILFGRADNRTIHPAMAEESFIEECMRTELTPFEESQLEDIMERRESGVGVLDPVANAKTSLQSADGDTVIGLFTNLPYDAGLENTNIVFEDMFEWVRTTVDILGDRTDVQVVLKPHPAEAAFGFEEPTATKISEMFPAPPDNLLILPPDTAVNPYKFIRDIDLGLVYRSTIGLEAAYRGVPVVVGADTDYRNLGFTFDPNSVDEYESMVSDPASLEMSAEMRALARRYAYALFVAQQVPLPAMHSEDGSLLTHEEIANDAFFDLVVDQIIAGEPVTRLRRWAPTARGE